MQNIEGLEEVNLENLYEESRNHYRRMLTNASPFPPEVLTVPRINALQEKNLKMTSLINSLYEDISRMQNEHHCSNATYISLQLLKDRIDSFAKELST